jgi:large subunit ribosomal protein L10
MTKNRELKVEQVASIQKMLGDAKSFVLVDYKGLNVAEDTELRVAFRQSGVKYKVLKNRLVKIALDNLGYGGFEQALNGPTGIAVSNDDTMAPYRVVYDKIKTIKNLQVKCGRADGAFMSEKDDAALEGSAYRFAAWYVASPYRRLCAGDSGNC